MKFTLFSFGALAFLFFLSPDLAIAQDPGNLTKLVPCEGPGCNACHVVQLGNNILRWLIGVLTIVFALVTAWAGFGLVTSGGNTQAKTQAKSLMTNAIIGFLIVLAAWLIVDTLLKSLLSEENGNLQGRPWSQVECMEQTGTDRSSVERAEAFREVDEWESKGCNFDTKPGEGSAAGYKCPNGCVMRTGQEPRCPVGVSYEDNPVIKPLEGGSGSETPPGCDNCTNIRDSLPTNGNECASGYTCVIRPDMLDRLTGTELATNGLRVSEAWPPTGYTEEKPNGIHKSSCHGNATCVDVSFRGNNPPASDVQEFIQNSSKNNLTSVYEVPNDTRKRELEAQGVTNVITVNGINREHFSVYMWT